MVNLLIADDNLIFAKELINEIINNNNSIRVCKITTDGKETLEVMNTENIDIVILDLIMPIYNGIEILNQLEDKEKYKNSIIVMSGDSSFIPILIENPLISDYIVKGRSKEEICRRVNRLIEKKDIEYKKKQIIGELKKIGYDTNYKGTNYLRDTILQLYLNNQDSAENLQREIYPIIAKWNNKTVHNIKCNINNATELMYCKCDIETLKKYFNFFNDTKPSIKTVIYTVISKIG